MKPENKPLNTKICQIWMSTKEEIKSTDQEKFLNKAKSQYQWKKKKNYFFIENEITVWAYTIMQEKKSAKRMTTASYSCTDCVINKRVFILFNVFFLGNTTIGFYR